MPKPWERNWGTAPVAQQKKPWERDWGNTPAAVAPVSDSAFSDNNVVQEQHPDISTADRLLIKNLAISPEVGAKYLRDKYPGMEVRVHKGEVIARKPGEKSYRVLDPDTGFFSKDFLADAGDVAFDLGKGAIQSAATAAGTAFGGVPGAVAAGGATSAGLEALRQKLGYALGLPQPNLDTGKVKLEGAFGAAFPAAGKVGDVSYKFLKGTALPKIGEMTSGVPAKVLKDYTQNAARVKFLDQNPDEFLSYIKDAKDKIIEGVQSKVQQTGEAIGGVLQKATGEGKFVDISSIKAALADKIAAAERALGKNPTPATEAPLKDLKAIQDEYFTQVLQTPEGTVKQEIPNLVEPDVAFKLKQQLKEIARPDMAPNAVRKLQNPTDKEVMRFGKEAMAKTTGELNKLDDTLPMLNKNYSSLAETADDTIRVMGNDQQAYNTIRGLDANSKKILQQRLNQVLTKDEADQLKETLQTIQTQSYMGDPASLGLSNLGSTSTSRTVPLSTFGAGAGSYLGYKMGNSPGSALIGGALGANTGAFLGSPKAVGTGLRILNSSEKAVGKIPGKRPATYGIGQSAWDALKEKYTEGK